MNPLPNLDHIALTVPNLKDQVERLRATFGMIVRAQFDSYALVEDPATGLKLELSPSDDSAVHFRHLGFATDDVEAAHAQLLGEGMETGEAPHRRDFARMYTSFLKDEGCVEVQLVNYD